MTDITLTPAARMAELKQNGFCIIENVADEWLLDRTRACVDKALAEVDPDRLQKTKSPGSLIDSNNYPELADLIGNPRALAELDRMGLKDIKFWKAVIISKPPGGPRLYWHQDCLMWQDPRAYSDRPPMIFLMYYLEDTTRRNGCLRLLPGTHRRPPRPPRHGGGPHSRDQPHRRPGRPAISATIPARSTCPSEPATSWSGDARMFHSCPHQFLRR